MAPPIQLQRTLFQFLLWPAPPPVAAQSRTPRVSRSHPAHPVSSRPPAPPTQCETSPLALVFPSLRASPHAQFPAKADSPCEIAPPALRFSAALRRTPFGPAKSIV